MEFKNIKVLQAVTQDLNDGRRFYDSIEEGVGDYFYDSLISDIESLKFTAGTHNKHFGLYRMLSKRFPYSIYYDIKGNTARVIAVLDMRRNPAWNQEVLENRDS